MAPTPWLIELNSEDIGIVIADLEAGLMKLSRVHPGENEMWHEICDLMEDLHASWEVVWPTERLSRRVTTINLPEGGVPTHDPR